MTEPELKLRTKAFALRALKLTDSLPEFRSARILAGRPGRSGTSVGANYRAACRSRFAVEMIARISVVEGAADEAAFGMELTADHGLMPEGKVSPLLREADELTAIMVSSRTTMLAHHREAKIQNRK